MFAVGVVPVASATGDPTTVAAEEPTLGRLLSGTTSVVQGTHVWTDYAYDDRGTDATAAPLADNAADLVQLQLRPGGHGLDIRAVLETLTDASQTSVGVGLDLDGDPSTGAPGVPVDGWTVAGAPLGLERFVTIDDTGTTVRTWDNDAWTTMATTGSSVDPAANTVFSSIPDDLLGDTGPTWRVVGTAGLVGGPVHDLAYVRDESTTNFQANAQAAILRGEADAGAAMAEVEPNRLEGMSLPEPVPGIKNTFLYRSHLDLGEGIDGGEMTSNRKYAGPYQPYVAWFPSAGLPQGPPMVVFMHGAMSTHLDGSYGDSGTFGPLPLGPGVIDPDAVVVTPLARAETPLGMDGPAEQDVLDVVADATTQFGVDENRIVLTGYSLGGVGTFRLAQLYPDRWAGAVEIVGAPDLGALTLVEELGGAQTLPNSLENLRNLPFRMAHSRLDELEILVGAVQPDVAALELHQLGYDYRYWQFYGREHLTFPVATIQCELEAAIGHGRVRDPARVTYSQSPALATTDRETGLDLHHDRAYWMSDMVVRGDSFEPGDEGTLDVTSLARADRVPATEALAGVFENVSAGRDVCGPNPDVQTLDVWSLVGQAWHPGAPLPVRNALEANLTRVASVRLDLQRMSIDAAEPVVVEVTADAESTIRLAGPWPRAVLVETPGQPDAVLCRVGDEVAITVPAGTSTTTLTPTSCAPGRRRAG